MPDIPAQLFWIYSGHVGELNLCRLQLVRSLEYRFVKGLLVMQGSTQHFSRHQVPRTSTPACARIDLTFRFVRICAQ